MIGVTPRFGSILIRRIGVTPIIAVSSFAMKGRPGPLGLQQLVTSPTARSSSCAIIKGFLDEKA